MDNQSILDNAPEGNFKSVLIQTNAITWGPTDYRSLADVKRILELEEERDKYEDLYNLAIAIEYPKKQTTMLMGNAANKTIRQQFEEHRPFIEQCGRDGWTMAAIAKRLDVTPIRLANAFKSLNLSINRLRSEGARL
jgi:hypothetical protein